MRCPHCQQTWPGIPCPGCGEETPEGSSYCWKCGKPIRGQKDLEATDSDLSERIPCRDGNCIGTVNESGVCNVCGKSYTEQQAQGVLRRIRRGRLIGT